MDDHSTVAKMAKRYSHSSIKFVTLIMDMILKEPQWNNPQNLVILWSVYFHLMVLRDYILKSKIIKNKITQKGTSKPSYVFTRNITPIRHWKRSWHKWPKPNSKALSDENKLTKAERKVSQKNDLNQRSSDSSTQLTDMKNL